jgi:hypothetical protein
MTDMAGKVSAKLDAFATWLLAGFGGATALMLTSHDAAAIVSGKTRTALELFLVAVIVTVAEKYIAVIVLGASEASASARVAMLDYIKAQQEAKQDTTFDPIIFAAEIARPLFWPVRWIAEASIRRALAGDATASGRLLLRLGQVQGLFLLAQIVLFVTALWVVVRSLPA